MTKRIGAEEARQHLPRLLDEASRGEITIVTKWGKPCAAIVPIDALPTSEDAESIIDLAGTGRGMYGDVEEYLRGLRDEWHSKGRLRPHRRCRRASGCVPCEIRAEAP